MGVKFARAFGAHVVLFTTSPGKVADGLRLGAHEVVVSTDADEMAKPRRRFDFILDTVSASHDINAYLQLLKLDGTLTLVGAPEQPLPVRGVPAAGPAPQLRRVGHRRHQGDAGDARLLRRARHRQRHRADSHATQINDAYERHAQERRELPLRHRHGVAARPRVADPFTRRLVARRRAGDNG